MGSFSNYLENKWLSHLLSTVFTPPTGMTFHLSTVNPGEDGTGIAEPSGYNYSSVNIVSSSKFATPAATRQIANTGDIVFPMASGSWGTISHWFIKDQLSNLLFYGSFTTPKAVGSGQTPKVLTGEVVISIPASNGMTTYLANEMLDHTFDACLGGSADFSQPTIYMGLGTNVFADIGAFTNEAADSGAYARKAFATWTVSGNAAENNGAITFTTASGSWGTISDWFLADGGTRGAGNMLLYGTFVTPNSIAADDQVNIPSGDLDITQD